MAIPQGHEQEIGTLKGVGALGFGLGQFLVQGFHVLEQVGEVGDGLEPLVGSGLFRANLGLEAAFFLPVEVDQVLKNRKPGMR